ncbi:hypothetical protein QA599_19500 [Haloarculaceae archaeon H-GB1-1]|nr:hypothetical protein [Haloarculaceae archaeon H-GB1-1]
MTTDGPVLVADLSAGMEVYAFNPATEIVKPKPVRGIQHITGISEGVSIEHRRANIHVAPDHRIPFQTKAIDRTRFASAEELSDREHYHFINDWRLSFGPPLDVFDVSDHLDEYEMCAATDEHGHAFRAALPAGCDPCRRNSHVGYCFDPPTFKQYQEIIESVADEVTIHAGKNHHRQPYRFDGDDVIDLIGWFVTEGSVSWKAEKDTATVSVAQETDAHRREIRQLFERMGLGTYVNTQCVQIGSALYGRLLEQLCGTDSHTKRLPEFVFGLSEDQQRRLHEVLLAGDGNKDRVYYTASEELAGDVLRLALHCGYKPTYSTRKGYYRIFHPQIPDQFRASEHVSRTEFDDGCYRLTVQDYGTVMAGRDGTFQWVGVSQVQ